MSINDTWLNEATSTQWSIIQLIKRDRSIYTDMGRHTLLNKKRKKKEPVVRVVSCRAICIECSNLYLKKNYTHTENECVCHCVYLCTLNSILVIYRGKKSI